MIERAAAQDACIMQHKSLEPCSAVRMHHAASAAAWPGLCACVWVVPTGPVFCVQSFGGGAMVGRVGWQHLATRDNKWGVYMRCGWLLCHPYRLGGQGGGAPLCGFAGTLETCVGC